MTTSGLPQTNLTPGQSGPDVKKLQSWLIQNGFNIPSGPTGNYGPETKAAVTQLQQQLGVQAGANSGYFGPLTIGAVTKTSAQTTDPFGTKAYESGDTIRPGIITSPQGPSKTGSPITTSPKITGTGINTDVPVVKQSTPTSTQDASSGAISQEMTDALRFMFDDATISSIPKSDLLQWGLMAEYLKKQNDAGDVTKEINAKVMQDAYTAAVNDPNIQAKYGDALKAAQSDMAQFQTQLQSSIGVQQTQQQIQFENERKALAEAHASAGSAYSGFRGKAQEQLGQTEQGIVTSTRSNIQKQLTDATKAFETKYGTAATKPASAEYADPLSTSVISLSGQSTPGSSTPTGITGETIGGITGTEAAAKQADINSRQQDIYNLTSSPVPVQKPITF